MIRVALRGLAGRKLRAALTAIAIVLGVAMVSGTYVLTDTISKAFDVVFTDSYKGTSVVVTGRSSGISFQGTDARVEPVPESLLQTVRQVPGVAEASGNVNVDDARLVGRNGKVVDTMGAPALGFGIDPSHSRFNPLTLTHGTWAQGPGEVVIDEGTADKHHYKVGDTIGVAESGPVQRFFIVGIARYGSVKSIGSATFAVFDLRTGQRLFKKVGKLDAISVAGDSGLTPEQLVQRIRSEIPSYAVVRTGAEQAQKDKESVDQLTSFVKYFLLAFGGIALFVGAFVIFNTLSITVAQRIREFATLRTIGASRRQVLTSVIVEALVIGALASLVGLGLGVLLAKGLNALFVAFGLDLPQVATVFKPRTAVLSLAVGIVVTLLAGLAPALRATKVPPIAAVREGARLPRSRLAPYAPWIAAATIALSVALLAYAMFAGHLSTGRRLISIAVGTLALFLGVALLSSRLVRPLARALGAPGARVGGAAGMLARENAMRNPARTAGTAAALMIGLALVTFVAVFGQGLRQSNRDAIEAQVRAQYVITSQSGFEPFTAASDAAVENAAGVAVATPVRSEIARIQGSSQILTGIDPTAIRNVYRFDWQHGSDAVLAQLGADGAIVDKSFANKKKLEIGDSVTVLSPTRKTARFVVRGIYRPPPFYPLLGAVSVRKDAFDRIVDPARNQYTFVTVRGGPSVAEQKALDRALNDFPDAKVQTREAWIVEQDKNSTQFLNLLYILLALSVVVSLFGMVNTLVLSVFERTRELGMLRAIGMTRRQVRRMVRHESVVTALIGAALGMPLGIFLAALVNRALSQYDVSFVVPVPRLILFMIVAVIAGILAAIVPARRAARLRVLEALQYE